MYLVVDLVEHLVRVSRGHRLREVNRRVAFRLRRKGFLAGVTRSNVFREEATDPLLGMIKQSFLEWVLDLLELLLVLDFLKELELFILTSPAEGRDGALNELASIQDYFKALVAERLSLHRLAREVLLGSST